MGGGWWLVAGESWAEAALTGRFTIHDPRFLAAQLPRCRRYRCFMAGGTLARLALDRVLAGPVKNATASCASRVNRIGGRLASTRLP
jgi:hypothetical protein